MGRTLTVGYDCDWCRRSDRPDENATFDDYPDGWEEIGGDVLCPSCQKARETAIETARAAAEQAGHTEKKP